MPDTQNYFVVEVVENAQSLYASAVFARDGACIAYSGLGPRPQLYTRSEALAVMTAYKTNCRNLNHVPGKTEILPVPIPVRIPTGQKSG